jgi:hypothetical protein
VVGAPRARRSPRGSDTASATAEAEASGEEEHKDHDEQDGEPQLTAGLE